MQLGLRCVGLNVGTRSHSATELVSALTIKTQLAGLITLNVPKRHERLLADNNTLLHEMVHQFLFERGEDPAHLGPGWRREIMRLTKQIAGREIWAGLSMTKRQGKGVVRINAPYPETKEPSLPQAIFARWPHDGLGIDLGHLGKCNT